MRIENLEQQVAALAKTTVTVIRGEKEMTRNFQSALDSLADQIQKNNDLIDSAKAMIAGIGDQILAAGTDQTRLNQLVQELRDKDDVLAQAMVATTPAATT